MQREMVLLRISKTGCWGGITTAKEQKMEEEVVNREDWPGKNRRSGLG